MLIISVVWKLVTMTCPICPQVIVASCVVVDRVGAGLPLSPRARRFLEDSDFDSPPPEVVLAGEYFVNRVGEEQTRGTSSNHLSESPREFKVGDERIAGRGRSSQRTRLTAMRTGSCPSTSTPDIESIVMPVRGCGGNAGGSRPCDPSRGDAASTRWAVLAL